MNNVEMLLRVLDSEPEDLTTVALLTDALMDERDMTRSEADRFAQRAVDAARDARDMAEAAALLEPARLDASDLLRDILNSAGVPPEEGAQVVIGPGDAVPVCLSRQNLNGGRFWHPITVSVGALWVKRHWRTHASHRSPSNQTKRKPQRSR